MGSWILLEAPWILASETIQVRVIEIPVSDYRADESDDCRLFTVLVSLECRISLPDRLDQTNIQRMTRIGPLKNGIRKRMYESIIRPCRCRVGAPTLDQPKQDHVHCNPDRPRARVDHRHVNRCAKGWSSLVHRCTRQNNAVATIFGHRLSRKLNELLDNLGFAGQQPLYIGSLATQRPGRCQHVIHAIGDGVLYAVLRPAIEGTDDRKRRSHHSRDVHSHLTRSDDGDRQART